jgi:hypothetical protein
MRRAMLLALSVLMVVSMAVSPAFAHDRDGDCWDEDSHFWSCNRDRNDGNRHHDGNRFHNDADDCVVFVFVPFGFWDFDFWNWVWFWRDLGSDWKCSD